MAETVIRPTRGVIDLAAIGHNVARLGGNDGAQVCAVVKADGYGHGAVEVAHAAVAAGATWLAVALVEEAIPLRAAGIDVPILLLSEPPVLAVGAVCEYDVTPFVYSSGFVAALQAEAVRRDRTVLVHVKLDTGMGRVGVPVGQVNELLAQLRDCDRLEVDGVGTHLARADETSADGVAETKRQLTVFSSLLAELAHSGLEPRFVHAANTAAALRYDQARRLRMPGVDTTTLLRCGIGLYGLSPSVDVPALANGLQPALAVYSAVSYVKKIAGGTPVSYGHRWRAPADGWLATVPIGYADGLPRALTNRAQVMINGRRLPLVGTVTMDQVLVWCADVPVSVDDPVILIGPADDGWPLQVEDWAEQADTITYEIASQLTARLPRTYVRPAGHQDEPLR